MAANTVLNYLPRQSVVHKMTGTTKLAFFLLFTFASMITYNTWVLLGLMAVSFAAFKLSHIKLREVRFMLIFMLVFLLLNNLFIFLFDPNQGTTLYGTRHVLFHLFWRYDVTAEQLFYMGQCKQFCPFRAAKRRFFALFTVCSHILPAQCPRHPATAAW